MKCWLSLVLTLLLMPAAVAANYHTAKLANGSKVHMPDPKLTPGRVMNSDVKTLCTPNHSEMVRDVTDTTKAQVMREYGLNPKDLPKYEIDHFISLEVGGSNDIANLWPQPLKEARLKDVVETSAHHDMCNSGLAPAQAQARASKDWPHWYDEYQKQRLRRKALGKKAEPPRTWRSKEEGPK